MFPLPDLEEFRRLCFWLTYKRYPGSGTNLTRSDVYAMTWEQLMWEFEMLQEVWSAEAKAIASKGKNKSLDGG